MNEYENTADAMVEMGSSENVSYLSGDRQEHQSSKASSMAGGMKSMKVSKPRGFAAMDRKLVSEIAKKGGQAAHKAGTAHEFTSEEARIAGRKGGQTTHQRRAAQVQAMAKHN